MDDKDPFTYPLVTYLWVIGLASVAGIIRHLNQMKYFSMLRFIIDVISSGFTGLITFWLCEWGDIHGPLSGVLIATSGMMGNRAWTELENLWRLRLMGLQAGLNPTGFPPAPATAQPEEQKIVDLALADIPEQTDLDSLPKGG